MLKQFSVLKNVLKTSSYDKVFQELILNSLSYIRNELDIPSQFKINNDLLNVRSYVTNEESKRDKRELIGKNIYFNLENENIKIDIGVSFSSFNINDFKAYGYYSINLNFKNSKKHEIKNLILSGRLNEMFAFSTKLDIYISDDPNNKSGLINDWIVHNNIFISLEQSFQNGRKKEGELFIRSDYNGMNSYSKYLIKPFKETIIKFLEEKNPDILTDFLNKMVRRGKIKTTSILNDRHYPSFEKTLNKIKSNSVFVNLLNSNFGVSFTNELFNPLNYGIYDDYYYSIKDHDVKVSFKYKSISSNEYESTFKFSKDDLIFILKEDSFSINRKKYINYNYSLKNNILKEVNFYLVSSYYLKFEDYEHFSKYFKNHNDYYNYTEFLSSLMKKLDYNFIYISQLLGEGIVDKLESFNDVLLLTEDKSIDVKSILKKIKEPLKAYEELKDFDYINNNKKLITNNIKK